jgi:lysylphosphatidylglycerol synthetase-like protein (DUF2156 family)
MRRAWHYFRNLLKSIFAIGFLAGVLLFAITYTFSDGELTDLARIVVVLILITVFTYVLRRLKLTIWAILTYLSYLISVVYAAQMLFTPDVGGGYRTAVLTVAMITAHGFVLGAFIELVTYVHRLTLRAYETFKEKTRLKLEQE